MNVFNKTNFCRKKQSKDTIEMHGQFILNRFLLNSTNSSHSDFISFYLFT